MIESEGCLDDCGIVVEGGSSVNGNAAFEGRANNGDAENKRQGTEGNGGGAGYIIGRGRSIDSLPVLLN